MNVRVVANINSSKFNNSVFEGIYVCSYICKECTVASFHSFQATGYDILTTEMSKNIYLAYQMNKIKQEDFKQKKNHGCMVRIRLRRVLISVNRLGPYEEKSSNMVSVYRPHYPHIQSSYSNYFFLYSKGVINFII
jgi:hypothetical protein